MSVADSGPEKKPKQSVLVLVWHEAAILDVYPS